MHLPRPGLARLGLLLGDTPPEQVRPLLLDLGDRIRPVDGVVGPDGAAPAAYLWADDPVLPPAGAAYAGWLRTAADARTAMAGAASVLITADPAVADETGALLVPARTAVPHARPILPAMRARLREQRGLPRRVLAAGEDTTWLWVPVSPIGEMRAMPIPRALRDTAAATASAVSAVGRALPVALAWGAPTVTDSASAAALGAVPGRDVVIAEAYDARLVAAKELADDPARAATVGYAGRRLMETRHDRRETIRCLLHALRLPTTVHGPGGGWQDTLELLHTPANSPARTRISGLMKALPASLAAAHPHERTP
ncbi:MAG: glycosyltransferase [Mycobacteriales bacterium]